jgi:ribosomal protein S18 acetylase RimI-like enzyme
MPVAELESLAVQAGSHSRFAVDRNIPREGVAALYGAWMRKCVAGEMADAVLVTRHGERIAGVVTIAKDGASGDLGLVAVAEGFRRSGRGTALVRAAQRWLAGKGCESVRAVTQGRNAAACALYRACGFSAADVACWYHFWL